MRIILKAFYKKDLFDSPFVNPEHAVEVAMVVYDKKSVFGYSFDYQSLLLKQTKVEELQRVSGIHWKVFSLSQEGENVRIRVKIGFELLPPETEGVGGVVNFNEVLRLSLASFFIKKKIKSLTFIG